MGTQHIFEAWTEVYSIRPVQCLLGLLGIAEALEEREARIPGWPEDRIR